MNLAKLILVLNCGSSSLKSAVLHSETGEVLLSALAEKIGSSEATLTVKHAGNKTTLPLTDASHTGAVAALMQQLQQYGLAQNVVAVGHRVVHGGERFKASCLIDDEVLAGIEACIPLAPLHNPANLAGIRAAQAIFTDLPQVAVFDTAFHQSMPEHAYVYAVPRRLYREHGLRRYGAHGTSYRFVAAEAARLLGRDQQGLRLVIAHLGNGASITAVRDGQSCDTSMGLTPLEGLVMGTRSGDIDPSVFGFLADNAGMSVAEVTQMLNKDSGLLGLSELSNDCRTLEEAAANGHIGAQLALSVFAYRLAKYVAAMAVASGGLDALVFTGGIGENSDFLRAQVAAHLAFLGVQMDEAANQKARFGQSGVISPADSRVLLMVVPTNEELMIAQDTAQLAGI